MGLCLSCLRHDEEEYDYNERTSLLRSQDFYSDDHLQEELLKKQQRQQELNTIVNELSENLIDVSTFLSNTTIASSSVPNTPNVNEYANNSNDKQYPYLFTSKEKEQLLRETKLIDDKTKGLCKVEVTEPLYLNF